MNLDHRAAVSGQKRHPGAEAVSFRLHDAMGLVTILAGGKTGGTTGAPRVTSRGFGSRFFTGKLGCVDFFHVNHHQTAIWGMSLKFFLNIKEANLSSNNLESKFTPLQKRTNGYQKTQQQKDKQLSRRNGRDSANGCSLNLGAAKLIAQIESPLDGWTMDDYKV